MVESSRILLSFESLKYNKYFKEILFVKVLNFSSKLVKLWILNSSIYLIRKIDSQNEWSFWASYSSFESSNSFNFLQDEYGLQKCWDFSAINLSYEFFKLQMFQVIKWQNRLAKIILELLEFRIFFNNSIYFLEEIGSWKGWNFYASFWALKLRIIQVNSRKYRSWKCWIFHAS